MLGVLKQMWDGRLAHPAYHELATPQELGRDAWAAYAEVSGVWLPESKRVALVDALRDASDADALSCALVAADLMLVSETSLRSFGVERPDAVLSALLERRDLLEECADVAGVWWVTAAEGVGPDPLISPTMHRNPNTRLSRGVQALPVAMMWVHRPTPCSFNVPPDEAVPVAWGADWVTRWTPRAPFWLVEELPTFGPATELAFAAAHPDERGYQLADCPDFLPEVCARVRIDDLRREMDGLHLAVLLRACCLLAAGMRDDLLVALASDAMDLCGDRSLTSQQQALNESVRHASGVWRPKRLKDFTEAALAATVEPDADLEHAIRALKPLARRMLRHPEPAARGTGAAAVSLEARTQVQTELLRSGQENLLIGSTPALAAQQDHLIDDRVRKLAAQPVAQRA